MYVAYFHLLRLAFCHLQTNNGIDKLGKCSIVPISRHCYILERVQTTFFENRIMVQFEWYKEDSHKSH